MRFTPRACRLCVPTISLFASFANPHCKPPFRREGAYTFAGKLGETVTGVDLLNTRSTIFSRGTMHNQTGAFKKLSKGDECSEEGGETDWRSSAALDY
jgi:hypothetical protein